MPVKRMRPNGNKQKEQFYATQEELDQAVREFDRSVEKVHEGLMESFDREVKEIHEYFSSHELPKDKNSLEYARLTPAVNLMKDIQEITSVNKKDMQDFEKIFQPLYQREYKKEYITSEYLGEGLAEREKQKLLKNSDDIFLSSTQNVKDAARMNRKVEQDIAQQKQKLWSMIAENRIDPQERKEREKAIRMLDVMRKRANKVFIQRNYSDSRVYIMGENKAELTKKMSEEDYNKFLNIATHQSHLSGFEVAEYTHVMGAIVDNLQKDKFEFKNVEEQLKYYQNSVYKDGEKLYDNAISMDIRLSSKTSEYNKEISKNVTGSAMKETLDEIEKALNTGHRFGFHSDTDEMKALKASVAACKAELKDFNQELLADPDKGMKFHNALHTMVENAKTYLAEKEKDGTALENRTRMGQTRYRAAQKLIGKFEKMDQVLTAAKEEEKLHKDPAYLIVKSERLKTKKDLYQLSQKPEWTGKDQEKVHEEVAKLVAIDKLEVEYRQNKNMDGPMWNIQKNNPHFLERIVSVIKDDSVIRSTAEKMDQEKLAEFIRNDGEQGLNQRHMESMLSEKEPAKAEKNHELQGQRTSVAQPKKEGPVL